MPKPAVSRSQHLALEPAWAPTWLLSAVTRREIACAVLATLAVLWTWQPLTIVMSRSLKSTDEQYSHIVLIPLITVSLLYLSRVAILRHASTALWAGAGLIAVGAGTVTIATSTAIVQDPDYRLVVAMTGLVAMWIGAFLTAYGPRALFVALYPLGLLFFLVPMPPAMVHRLIVFLQHASADGTAVLFGLIGLPVFRQNDVVFALPGLTIQVAEECSGIRSSLALLVSGLVMGYVFLRTWWARAGLAAVILPLAIVKNAVRIVLLSWLAINVDPSFITGGLTHRTSGIPVFILSMLTLAGIIWLLRWAESRRHA